MSARSTSRPSVRPRRAKKRRAGPKRAAKNRLRVRRSRPPSSKASPPRRRRWLFWVAGVVAVMALGAGLSGYAYLAWRRTAPSATRRSVAVSWPVDLDAREGARLLSELGLTDDPVKMELFLRLRDGARCFVAGPHLLPMGATPSELLAALCRSDDRPKAKITVPEGFHRFAIARRLEEAGVVSAEAFLAATADRRLLHRLEVDEADTAVADSAEGYLFPATYVFSIDSPADGVVERMVTETKRRFARLASEHAEGLRRLEEDLGFGRREVLVLASMVEKEAAVAEERPLIASVFLNRLIDPEFPHLQSDPTAVYGCWVMPKAVAACADFDGRARGAINRDRDNIYSTYVTRGLPPGPIANPGDASIAAVLAPAETDFRFFVAKGEGRHAFSVTFTEHTAAVKRLRALTR